MQRELGKKKNKQPRQPYQSPAQKIQAMEVINVDGIRYIREDLVPQKMESIMERIAVAQEKQSEFYAKYDAQIAPLMDMVEKTIKEQIGKIKSKNTPFS